MLQKLKQASEAGEKLSEVPVSDELYNVNYTADIEDCSGKEHDEHESSHVNVVKSAIGDDDNDDDDSDDAVTDVVGEKHISNINGMSPVLCQANSDSEPSDHSTVCEEMNYSERQADAEIDQCTVAKSNSVHDSPCADDDDTQTTPGISL